MLSMVSKPVVLVHTVGGLWKCVDTCSELPKFIQFMQFVTLHFWLVMMVMLLKESEANLDALLDQLRQGATESTLHDDLRKAHDLLGTIRKRWATFL